ncbi:DUF1566 domain-containing protein [Cyclobacteriaceae bacterium]|nr:DUF1566 domain-containing protein [Cyclobacteriaceae bacterium]
MNRFYLLLTAILLTNVVWAQAPEKMSYQAVIRGTDNILYTNQDVSMQIGILQGSASGDLLYLENHTPTTNKNGLISIEIGAGSLVSGSFTDIDWSKGPYFILTMTDPTGGTNYSITGTSQLLSVPYALHAQTAENITGEITVSETDPLFSSSIASSITATDTAKWNQSNTTAGAQLDSAGIATMGYVAGPKTIDTKLDETAVDAFVANNGYLTQEKDSSVTNEIELPTGGNSGQILSTDGSGTYSWIDAGAGGLVADTINDGTTGVAPSQNAVFDGLALKAPLASPTFTGTVSGIDKTMVGLTNVDNTSDADKPVSTATQTVLDLKESAANKSTDGTLATNSDEKFPTEKAVKTYVDAIEASGIVSLNLKAPIADAIFTGTPTAPTAASGTNTTQIATTAFVQSAAASDINGLSDALVESGSIYIGSDPSSTTDDASSNTSLGGTALDAITTGDFNVAIGSNALSANTTGQYNAASGTNALYSNTTGSQNTASGSNALYSNTTGGSNVAFGNSASYRSTTGNWNTSVGYQALSDNTTGDHNVALGSNALYANTTSDYNVAIGSNALSANTTGSRNVVSGHDAGDLITTGSNNVILGNSADPSANNATNQIVIGYNATGIGDNKAVIGNSSVTDVYMSQDAGATVHAGALNLGGTATATTFSGDFNGTINTATTAATQSSGDNSTKIATTAYADAVLQPGTATGQMNYWNGSAWVVVAPGTSLPGNQAQTLVFCNGVPTWGTCPAVVPTLSSTTAASSITGTTSSNGGVISNDGGASVTARGVAWSTSTAPTISDSYTTDGTGTGTFTSSLTGLTPGTTYYVRAYATNSVGTAYGAEVSFTTAAFSGSIGDAYQGGKVAYILQSGDPGYVAGEVHGLIAATSDQSTGIIWNNDGTKATRGATGIVIGTGLANTNAIINKQGEPATSYAAGLARAYTGGGYTDWYLPSKEELNKLYINRVAIGGFANAWYWNSTEYNLSVFTFGWCQNFNNGNQDAFNDVTWAVNVRAIRAF